MITLILAVDQENGIGKDNTLPWGFIREDMSWFRRQTLGNTVIMGRNTWESLPATSRPLRERRNVVLTHSSKLDDKELLDCAAWAYDLMSPQEIVDIEGGDVFIIGGAQVLNHFAPLANRVMITRITGRYHCDTFFDVESTIHGMRMVDREVGEQVVFETYTK